MYTCVYNVGMYLNICNAHLLIIIDNKMGFHNAFKIYNMHWYQPLYICGLMSRLLCYTAHRHHGHHLINNIVLLFNLWWATAQSKGQNTTSHNVNNIIPCHVQDLEFPISSGTLMDLWFTPVNVPAISGLRNVWPVKLCQPCQICTAWFTPPSGKCQVCPV